MMSYLQAMCDALEDKARITALALDDDAEEAIGTYRREFDGFTRELSPDLCAFVTAEQLGECIGGLTGRRVRQMAREGVFLSIKVSGQRGHLFHLGYSLWAYLEHAEYGTGGKPTFPLAGTIRRARDAYLMAGAALAERDGTVHSWAMELAVLCAPKRKRKQRQKNDVSSETSGVAANLTLPTRWENLDFPGSELPHK